MSRQPILDRISLRSRASCAGASAVAATLLHARLAARRSQLAPGIALSATLAIVAMLLGSSPWLQQHGLSALTLAIALAMLVGNTAYVHLAPMTAAGVA